MSPKLLRGLVLVAATAFVAACTPTDDDLISPQDSPQESTGPSFARSGVNGAGSYLVISTGQTLKEGFEAEIEALGGTVTRVIPEIGVAAVSFDGVPPADLQFAVSARSVIPNLTLQWFAPLEETRLVTAEDVGNPPASDDDDFYFDLQWGPDAVDAPEAWNMGARGAGVRVAMLDDGLDSSHPDLAPNLNAALSTSFVGGETFDSPPGAHGSHTAGIVAAADNAFGTIGIAPEAELVSVKVLSAINGSGSFDGILAGIVYAALIDSDVINMSLGTTISHRGEVFNEVGVKIGEVPAWAISELAVAFARATTFATQQGTTVVTSAGNAATNGDKDKDRIHLPSDAPNVISVAATGPVGWAIDPSTDLDRPASYTNYGTSVISFAAPGGDAVYPGNEACLVGEFVVAPCWYFDLVFSTVPGGWTWAAGTSMAAPHVAGVAALIIGANGGEMSPSHVLRELRRSADDLGKPGKDMWYGYGRVNAYNAVN